MNELGCLDPDRYTAVVSNSNQLTAGQRICWKIDARYEIYVGFRDGCKKQS